MNNNWKQQEQDPNGEGFSFVLVSFTMIAMMISMAFVMFVLPSMAHAGGLTFSWLPNSEEKLAGYDISYGATSRNYTEVFACGLPDTVDGRVYCTIPEIPGGKLFFACTAFDSDGMRSDYSDELTYDGMGKVQSYRIEGTIQGTFQGTAIPIVE